MKTKFTQSELLDGRGCYSTSDIFDLLIKYGNKKTYLINKILKSDIPLKDKQWFVYNNCNLTLQEKRDLAVKLAWCVLPIYENKYPSDNRIKDCLQAIEDFKIGKITMDILREKRNKAYAAYAAASAAANAADAAVDANAANAADAAAYAAANANAANAAYAAAYAAVDAADAQKIINILINFVK